MVRHYAFIPARAGSKGFPGKNRYFFNFTADFIDASGLFDGVLVTTDDDQIIEWAQRRGYFVRRRPATLARDTALIKDAAVDLAANADHVRPGDYLWLNYMTTVFKSLDDYRAARAMVDRLHPPAFCSFIPAGTHPYITWYQDAFSGKMRQFVPNNLANRQDMPPAYQNFHYLSGFRVDSLPRLNANLLGEDTYPIYLDEGQQQRLCDLDTPADLIPWRTKHPNEYARWLRSLPPGVDRSPLEPYLADADQMMLAQADHSPP